VTRQIAFEPLPASVLFGVAVICGKDVGKESEYFRLALEFVAIGSDRFGRAGIGCFHRESGISSGCLRLAQDEGPTTVVVLGVNGRDNLQAKVAVDAGLIDVELAGFILVELVW